MPGMESATTRTISRIILTFGLVLLLMTPLPFIAVYAFSLDLPLPIALGAIMLSHSPFATCAVYLGWQQLASAEEKQQTKGIRYWIGTYLLLVLLILCYTCLAVIFDMLAPTLSLAYRTAILPMLIILITLLIVTRTRLRPEVEKLLNRLLHEKEA